MVIVVTLKSSESYRIMMADNELLPIPNRRSHDSEEHGATALTAHPKGHARLKGGGLDCT